MEITKEMIENYLGYEINDFKLEPIFNKGIWSGLNINISPKRKLEYIDMKFTIQNSDEFLNN